MVLKEGDKIHVITRRGFEGDLRRHFVGQVEAMTDTVARVCGFSFVFDPNRNEFIKRTDKRVRIIGIVDSGNVINVLPDTVRMDDLTYGKLHDRLVLTDGAAFRMDINEFSHIR